MNKSLPLIVVLALVAVAGFGLFFINQGKLAKSKATAQEQVNTLQEEQQRLSEVASSLRDEKTESAKLVREAVEARQMAEAQAEKERKEREKLVNELNARLLQEADERREAEAAQLELATKIAALEAAQIEAQQAMKALEAERVTTAASAPVPEEEELAQTISFQQEQLAALTAENQALKERQQSLEAQQIATEEAIVSAGGKVSLPYPEIRSPNVRRKEAIYFKQRVAGHPNP